GFDINGVWGSIDQPVALHLNSITSVSNYEANESKVSVYPNPFSNVLNIKYASERAGYIELIVADPIGNIVENRAEAIKHGINHLEWRPKAGTSGGTYFLTIVSEDKVETHKVLLIK
nr:T9SS type A sorting domain-containing protein [Saprospiraceae bacterium]